GRVKDICDHHRKHKSEYKGFKFYPCMPYAHKYANAVTEHGMVGAVRQFVPSEGLVNTMLRGGASLARQDIEGISKILVDAEMKMFDGLNTPVIFLQNVVVDLILGLGMHSAFKVFREHVREKYQAEAGFITMNFPLLLKALADEGVRNPVICTNFNKLGFRMSGGLEAYREALDNYEVRTIAMSVFASGAIPPDEAIDWIAKQDGVESIVFGASSQKNIRQTAELVHRHFGRCSVSR
ncbi:MAG: hypothetical protein OER77_16940, partial [Myxococcales bacterium]|nr:hypothetical protein [Myxococcales bacterium]